MTDPDYMIEYDAFQANFRKTEVSGEEIGEIVMHMANYFARYNVRLGDALRVYSSIKSQYQNQLEPGTSKTMSSAKAETMADSTPEAAIYEMARIHVQNIEQYINALKTLQKGVLQEYAHSA